MSFAAERWPPLESRDPGAAGAGRRGFGVVWRLELLKNGLQLRTQVLCACCLLGPLLAAAAVSVQPAVPADTLFGQWLHESGFALPLVILGFAGQWLLPLLAAIVAGDIFSAEDRFGTWKTVLTRSHSRGDLFAGKVLAASTWLVTTFLLLAAGSLLAAATLGLEPIVGLGGQLVPPHRALALVAASWLAVLAPTLGYGALAVLLSILARSSLIGVGGPVLAGLVMQLSSMIDLPLPVRDALLSTPFGAWHGFWVPAAFLGPLRVGLLCSAGWSCGCLGLAWLIFRRRDVSVR